MTRSRLCLLTLLILLLSACAQATPTTGPEEKGPPVGDDLRLVEYEVSGGIAGFCDHLTILSTGQATIERACKDERETIQLSAEAMQEIKAQAEAIGGYTYEDPGEGQADAMAVAFRIYGEEKANPPSQQALDDFQALLMRVLTGSMLPQ